MDIKIGLVDDHKLFLQSLGMMLGSFQHYKVVIEAWNGKELQEKLKSQQVLPDIMLIDVNMPVMDGIQTAIWLKENYPVVKLVALSMKDDDKTIIDMIKAGCCAYLLKDTNPNEIDIALKEVNKNGYYNSDVEGFDKTVEENVSLFMSEKEKLFLQYICTDSTYKQIAAFMNVTDLMIEGYQVELFKKLHVHSRIGLAMEAIHKKLVIV